MKKWIVGLLSLMMVLSLAGCGTSAKKDASNGNTNQKASKDLYQTIKAKGVITIGTEGTYPPFTYHDATDKLTGFDVEIATEVAKRLGVKPQFIETKWSGMLAGLDDKRYDMVANEVGIRPDREQKYLFSDPYISSNAVLIVKKGSPINKFSDLKGKKVAQSLTSNYLTIAKKYGAVNTPVDGFNQAADLIKSGRVDATVNDKLSFLDLKKHQPNLPLVIADQQNNAGKSAFLLRKGSDDLAKHINKALADMKKDGTYLKISKKYFGQDVSK